jgi:hypothetical protein
MMSSYLDHHAGPGVPFNKSQDITHSWLDFTYDRLAWLYGDERAVNNYLPSANADLRAWLALGKKGRAA